MSTIENLRSAVERQLGFSMLERVADVMTGLNWTLKRYDIAGKQIAICDLKGKGVGCQ